MSAPTSEFNQYPWYRVIVPDSEQQPTAIEQGDILENFPLLFSVDPSKYPDKTNPAERVYCDLVILSQSCDLADGGIDQVVTCPLLIRSNFDGDHPVSRKGGMENLRKGKLAAFQLLNKCDLQNFEREWRIVDFGEIHSIPIFEVREHLSRAPHLRLLPPYREHLSQAFARFFMRVGLPLDIPRFD
jgi:hypothetical protein